MPDVDTNRWVIEKALKALPVTKYALGLAAIAILASIGRSAWSSIPIVGMLPLIGGVLLLMVLLIVISRLADGEHTRGPAVAVVWAISLSFIAVLLASVSVLLTGWPPTFARLILPEVYVAEAHSPSAPNLPTPTPSPSALSGAPTPTSAASQPAALSTATVSQPVIAEKKAPFFVLLVCGVAQSTKDDLRGQLNRRGTVISEKDFGDAGYAPIMAGNSVVFYYDDSGKKFANSLSSYLSKDFYVDQNWEIRRGKGSTIKDKKNTYTINMMGAGCVDTE